ncbi:extracellular solute-binding protein [Streptomyces sp. NBC_00353]|uniref:extracellular solute-binding protein n=1 Tax=Streptomyces sp. NBC_00353 TaxID=2975722 RepID=UPI002E25307B
MPETTPLVLLGRKFDGFERALTAQFRAIPDVSARFELVEIGDLEDKVLHGDGATSGANDVLMLITDWLPALIESGRLLPLDEHFAAAPPQGWPDAWVPSLRELQRGPDGKTYGIAYHDGPMMQLYRTDLYGDPKEQAGFAERFGYPLAPATNWSQMHDQAIWFNRPDEGLYGTVQAGFPDEHNNVYDFLTHLWSRGGELIDGSGRSGLDRTPALEAIDYLHDLWHVSRVVDPAAADWDSVASGVHFAAGEAAMMVNWCGFAALSADPQSPTHGLVGCAPVPGGEGPDGSTVTMNAYWVLTVASGTSDPDRAIDLIRRLATHEMDVRTAIGGGSATRRDSWAATEVQAIAPYYGVLEQAHAHARSVPVDSRWPVIAGILNEMMRAVVVDASGRRALEQAHARLNEFLAGTKDAG